MKPLEKPLSSDNCPDWAKELITKIYVLEVEAGTIKTPSESADSPVWSTAKIEELLKAANGLDNSSTEAVNNLSDEIEIIFTKIVRGLAREGHSPMTIATMINIRIPTGCRLPYCSASEVEEALV